MKPKKKILVFTDWFIPGFKAGGPIRSCVNLVENLNDIFDFSVITRDTDYCETTPYASVKSNEWNKTKNGLRIYYFSADQLNKKNIRAVLAGEEFDFVYMNSVFSLYFTIYPLLILKKNKFQHIVLAPRGMFAKNALAIKAMKKNMFLFLARCTGLFNDITFSASNYQEAGEIKKAMGVHTSVKIAANLPKKDSLKPFTSRTKISGSVKLINIARIAPEKNLKYALEVLLMVEEKVEFDIYGPIYDRNYWEECRKLIEQMPVNIKINYKQAIENNKIPLLLPEYHFMFMPTLGENFGHIILESLSSGCPVIISDKTIWKNAPDKPVLGWDIPLDQKSLFVDTIEKCAGINQEEYIKISESAYKNAVLFRGNNNLIKENTELFIPMKRT